MRTPKKIFAILALVTLSFNYSFATWIVATWAVSAPESTWAVSPTSSTGVQVPSTDSWAMDLAKVDWIDFLDDKTLSIKLSKSLNWISKDSEVKILEDLSVVSSSKDATNLKKVNVQLNSDLIDNSSYSLVSVSEWLDTSIDFTLSWDKSKILNPNFSKDETSIEYISVIDPRNIEVYFNKDLNLNAFEFKMFKELKVESMFLDTTNLNVKMLDALTSKKDYIAILSLKDETNKDIEIENSLYDFNTPEFATPTPEVAPTTDVAPLVDTNTWTEIAPANSASGEVTEEVAMKANQTPDTWTKTNILLFITFILTLSLFILKRKSFKV